MFLIQSVGLSTPTQVLNCVWNLLTVRDMGGDVTLRCELAIVLP